MGRSKILMMPEIRSVLEKCMDKASEMRNKKAKIIKKVFDIYLGAKEFRRKKEYVIKT